MKQILRESRENRGKDEDRTVKKEGVVMKFYWILLDFVLKNFTDVQEKLRGLFWKIFKIWQ